MTTRYPYTADVVSSILLVLKGVVAIWSSLASSPAAPRVQ